MKPFVLSTFAIPVVKLLTAVVCTLNPSAEAATTVSSKSETNATAAPSEFVFKGGTFPQFVTEMRAYFGTNELQLLQIPASAHDLEIPRMRIPDAAANRKDLEPAEARTMKLRYLFFVYNRISESGDWFLGKWVFDDATGPNPPPPLKAIIFSPPKSVGIDSSDFTVRAYSLRGLPAEDKKTLLNMIEEEAAMTRDEFQRTGSRVVVSGNIRLHPTTELLVAKGGKIYIDLVTAIVEAFLHGGLTSARPGR